MPNIWKEFFAQPAAGGDAARALLEESLQQRNKADAFRGQFANADEVLSTLAEFYAANIDSSIKSIVSLLEPLLLLGLGLLVGTIALSIILPIYQLTSSIGG